MASNGMEGTGPYKNSQSATKQDRTGYKQKPLNQVSQLTLANTSNDLTFSCSTAWTVWFMLGLSMVRIYCSTKNNLKLECVFAQLCKPLDYFQQLSGFSYFRPKSTELLLN